MSASVKTGDRLRLTRPWRGHGAAEFRGKFPREFSCVLPKDTVLVSLQDAGRFVFGFGCRPEEYETMEREFIPEDFRKDPNYDGYSFIFFIGDIGSLLDPLSVPEE